MDFDQAVVAHSAWKRKLADYLNRQDGSLNPSEAAMDNKCPLGKWIYGEGVQFAKTPEYAQLKSDHARFHKAVAEVISRANAGKSVAEEIDLGAKSEFASASSAVVLSIMKLKQAASQPVS